MKPSVIIRSLVPLASIAGIVILILKALALGVDGVLLAGAVAAISGLGGYEAKVIKDFIKSKEAK